MTSDEQKLIDRHEGLAYDSLIQTHWFSSLIADRRRSQSFENISDWQPWSLPRQFHEA